MTVQTNANFARPYTAKVVVGVSALHGEAMGKTTIQGVADSWDDIYGNGFWKSQSVLSDAPAVNNTWSSYSTRVSMNSIMLFNMLSGVGQTSRVSWSSPWTLPLHRTIFAVVTSPDGAALAVKPGVAVSGNVTGVSDVGGAISSAISLKASLIAQSFAPVGLGSPCYASYNCFYDDTLDVDANKSIRLHSEQTIADAIDAAVRKAVARLNYEAFEVGELQNKGVSPTDDRRTVYSVHISGNVPATETEDVNLFIAKLLRPFVSPTNDQGWVVMSEAEVKAVDAALLALMQETEKTWLTLLRKASRDGISNVNDFANVFKKPAGLLDPRKSEQMALRIDKWFADWTTICTEAVAKKDVAARKDAAWEEYKKRHPDSNVTRAQFEANPSAFLPDSEWLPSSNADLDKGWWETIKSGLGWAGGAVTGLLNSVDSSTLATLFAAGAAAGWFGDGLQTFAWIAGGIWLLSRTGGASRATPKTQVVVATQDGNDVKKVKYITV